MDTGKRREYFEKNHESQLINAAKSEHWDVVKKRIREGFGIDTKDSSGFTPLMIAAIRGNFEMVKYLVKRGANVKSRDNLGNTALLWAAKVGHANIVNFLLEKGSPIHAENKLHETALSAAVKLHFCEITELLIRRGGNVDDVDSHGLTCLMNALCWRDLDFLKSLISSGCNLNKLSRCDEQNTALIKATLIGYPEAVELLLLAGADPNIANKCGNTALIIASGLQNFNVVKILVEHQAQLDQTNSTGFSALDIAAVNGSLEIFEFLISSGSDVNQGNQCPYREPTLLLVAYMQMNHIIKPLLDAGSDVNVVNLQGLTVFEAALSAPEHLQTVKCLIDAGYPVKTTDLCAAIRCCNSEVVQCIAESQNVIFADDWQQNLSLVFDEIIQLTQSAFWSLHLNSFFHIFDWVVESQNLLEDYVSVEKERNNNLETCGFKGTTVLILAVTSNDLTRVKALIAAGAEVDIVDPHTNYSLIMLAVLHCLTTTFAPIMEALLEAGCDINYSSIYDGKTALMKAADSASLEKVTWLVEHGASVEMEDKDSNTAFSLAVKYKRFEIVEYLERFMCDV